MKRERKQTGITLIALVITVIVLLILAGVTIAALSGDNGILTRAKEAKEKTEQAQENESKTLSNMENILGVYNFKNINKADTNPAEAIPENSTIIEGDANKGIVIKDKNENEWVWVEVTKTTVFGDLAIDTTQELTEQNYTDIKNKLIAYATTYREGSTGQGYNWTDEWYAKDGSTLITASTSNLTEAQKALTNGCGLTYDEYKTAYQKMLKSVYTYGGFWIGRYEAGIEGTTTETTNARTDSSARISIETSPKAISQKDAIPYNYVYCSEAQALAKEMTPNNSYTSSLMFGIQWDLVCKYLEVKGKLAIADINSNSTNWGNYSNVGRTISSDKAKQTTNSGSTWTAITGTKPTSSVLLTTGASEETNKMNIYDFAGNEWERTLEQTSDSDYICAIRGGNYFNTGSIYPASFRGGNGTTGANRNLGFRPTLYVNLKLKP